MVKLKLEMSEGGKVNCLVLALYVGAHSQILNHVLLRPALLEFAAGLAGLKYADKY